MKNAKMKHWTPANPAPAKDHGQFWGFLSGHDDVAGRKDRSEGFFLGIQQWKIPGVNNINGVVC